ncbi:MAG: FeoA family protein [Thermodesulfobacteriota bacterium]|nr:FeoA family protein [Thermodesulfobacteriota bacterium]
MMTTTALHMPVSALQPESECIIRSLGDDDKTAQRLAQMGILPGTHLRIIRIAPLGGTIEVTSSQGQSFALRQQDVAAMTCDPVSMPLASELVIVGQTYRVRILLGGKTFLRRMEKKGLRAGELVQIQKIGVKPIPIYIVDMDKQIELGEGEAKKIIIEVISHGSLS